MATASSDRSGGTQRPGAATSGLPAAPSIALPKGGGAIRGIGEKFGTNPVTGTTSFTVSIPTSAGRSGFTPQLGLRYDSGFGNGPFGFGWQLALPEIARKTDKGAPQYRDADESDVFTFSDAEDLVPLLEEHDGRWHGNRAERALHSVRYEVRRYRPRVEAGFVRVERWHALESDELFWVSITRDNVTSVYGRTPNSRIFDPADPRRIFKWLICESFDDRGNALSYEYKAEDDEDVDRSAAHESHRERHAPQANRYLKRIRYGNRTPHAAHAEIHSHEWMFEVVFDYGDHDAQSPRPAESRPWPARRDAFSTYRPTFEVRTHRLCRRVLMFHHFPDEPTAGRDCLVSSMTFDYRAPGERQSGALHQAATFMTAVRRAGHAAAPEGVISRDVPPLEFEYSEAVLRDEVRTLDRAQLQNLPSGLDTATYRWVDLDGDGMAGLLTSQGNAWFYKRNLGEGRFAPTELVREVPSLAFDPGTSHQLLDLAGDGRIDLVVLKPHLSGFHERGEGGWTAFRPFATVPNIRWDDPNLQLVDLNGDGFSDVLVTEGDVMTWYPSLGEDGWGEAQRISLPAGSDSGPRLVFGRPDSSLFLADMSGDGSADFVRVRNGEVCYWPNLAHGRFGSMVTMSNSPWFDSPGAFDSRRVRLADIDGSGCSDLLYLGSRSIAIYANQSGNGWSAPRVLEQLPITDRLSSVTTVDLLGNGTACLVWSSPLPGGSAAPLQYIDLMGGQKPHLLVRVVNNLGAETRIHYAPSTRFYALDREQGTPWVTPLPFPVHVVERVETLDRISHNRFVSRFSYHHGYFDGYEREFRGFGRVDQWDTEEFGVLARETPAEFGDNIDATSHVPPVLTRTWFHTGWFDSRDEISKALAAEYYRSPDADDRAGFLLPDTTLPEGLSVVEARQAARALKGSMLRQEVFALDGTEAAGRPYRISERSHTIRQLQPMAGNRHAVFFSHGHQAIDFHYERAIYEVNGAVRTDPRISHEFTLAVDAFGNVLQSANIAYGRRYAELDASLSEGDRDTERRTHARHTAFRYTNAVDTADAHRTPAPCDTRSFEVVLDAGRAAALPFRLLTHDEVSRLVADASRLNLLEHTRTIYRSDDLSGPLPEGVLESRGLFFESYKLALTQDSIAETYGTRVSRQMLASEGGYVQLPGHAGWWVPSGRFFYTEDPDATPADELATATAHFFHPRRYRDPFHAHGFSTDGTLRYDRYDLLVEFSRDALGNVVTAGERAADQDDRLVSRGLDYRVLQPFLVMDANRNRSTAAFDALGLVVGTAVMGKPEEPELGDRLDAFVANLDEGELLGHLRAPLAAPARLLQGATTRLLYDVHAYTRTKHHPQPQPAAVATLARETHGDSGDAPVRVQQTFVYFDGFGREIQKKVDTERDDESPKWLGTSWTVFNNKEKPVRKFEPFFSATHGFEFNARLGVSAIICYDPLQRIVATIYPNHTWEKTSFTPWRQDTWDVSDTLLEPDPALDGDVGHIIARIPRSEYLPTWYAQRIEGGLGAQEKAAAQKAAVHARTPGTAHLDGLGREFARTSLNRRLVDGAPHDESHTTRAMLDAGGNQRELRDAAGRLVMRGEYDLQGNRLHLATIDAGDRWHLFDVMGEEICVWTLRGHRVRTRRDQLRRPAAVYLQQGDGAEVLIERTEYGESALDAEGRNLRGRPLRTADQSGTMTSGAYDFKGNMLSSVQRVAVAYSEVLDWAGEVALDPREFETRIAYDALNRRVSVSTSDGSTIRPAFNISGLLERADVNVRGQERDGELVWTPIVTDIDYDPKGQRIRVDYGNGVSTGFAYDPFTFRLSRLTSTRPEGPPLQDLHYTYDPAGNITHVWDEARPTAFFRNQQVDAGSEFTYDAVYRLIEATGREHLGQAGASPVPFSHDPAGHTVRTFAADDAQAVGRYVERYEYDAPGNLRQVGHRALGTSVRGWTRTYRYDESSPLDAGTRSGRVSSTAVDASTVEHYDYDAHGNTVRMPHLPSLDWDFRDRLRRVQTQTVTGDEPEGGATWYVYDTAGRRVRKVTERAPGVVAHECVYAEGVEFERRLEGEQWERDTLHVMDDKRRVALIEATTNEGADAPEVLVRYQLANHLGSATVELDGDARVLSYEEFTPFGSTALHAVEGQTETRKRYRYCGKERDDESGFYYYGARYYAPWLGRWVSCDPASTSGKDWARSDQAYVYVENRPIAASDPDGRIIWFIVIGAVALTTVTVVSPANAPTSATDKTYPRISNTEFAFHTGVNALSMCGGSAAGKWIFSKTESVLLSSTAAGGVGGFIQAPGNQFVTDVADGDFASPGEYATMTAESTLFGAGTGLAFGGVAKGWQWLKTPSTPEFRIPGRAPSGTAAEAQAWDDAGQQLDDIIRNGGPFPAETRGVGAAVIDVPGYPGATELRGFSAAATDALGEGAAVVHVQSRAPADRIFQTFRSWRGAQGGAIPRVNDVEPKLFSEIAENLPPNAKGTIHLMTMRTRAGGTILEPLPACLSCQNVTFQFAGLAPDVQVVSHAAVNPAPLLDLFPEALRPAAQSLLPYAAAFFGTTFSSAATTPKE